MQVGWQGLWLFACFCHHRFGHGVECFARIFESLLEINFRRRKKVNQLLRLAAAAFAFRSRRRRVFDIAVVVDRFGFAGRRRRLARLARAKLPVRRSSPILQFALVKESIVVLLIGVAHQARHQRACARTTRLRRLVAVSGAAFSSIVCFVVIQRKRSIGIAASRALMHNRVGNGVSNCFLLRMQQRHTSETDIVS